MIEDTKSEKQIRLPKTTLQLDRRLFLGTAAACLGGEAASTVLYEEVDAQMLPAKTAPRIDKRTITASKNSAVVDTACGKVNGYARDGIFTFKGMPYGESIAGATHVNSRPKSAMTGSIFPKPATLTILACKMGARLS